MQVVAKIKSTFNAIIRAATARPRPRKLPPRSPGFAIFGQHISGEDANTFASHFSWRIAVYGMIIPFIYISSLTGATTHWPDILLIKKLIAFFLVMLFAFNATAAFCAAKGWLYSFDSKLVGIIMLIISSVGLGRLGIVETDFMKSNKDEFSKFILDSAPSLRSHAADYERAFCQKYLDTPAASDEIWTAHTAEYCLWLSPMKDARFEDFTFDDWSYHLQKEAILAIESFAAATEFRHTAQRLSNNRKAIEIAETAGKYDKDVEQIVSFWALAVAIALGITKSIIEIFKLDEFSNKVRRRII